MGNVSAIGAFVLILGFATIGYAEEARMTRKPQSQTTSHVEPDVRCHGGYGCAGHEVGSLCTWAMVSGVCRMVDPKDAFCECEG